MARMMPSASELRYRRSIFAIDDRDWTFGVIEYSRAGSRRFEAEWKRWNTIKAFMAFYCCLLPQIQSLRHDRVDIHYMLKGAYRRHKSKQVYPS